jgi:hypothetical protein
MPLSRRLGAVGAATLLALTTLALTVAPVAATDVDTDAELRAAWADAAETLITLTDDITLACTDQPERDSDTDIVIEGGGFTLTQPCENDDALHATGGGNVTVRSLVLTGNPLSDDGIDTEARITLESSSVTGFAENGLETDGPVDITGSFVTDNGSFGIESEAEVLVTSSVVADNGEVGVWSGDEDDAIVVTSTISGNGGNGVDSGVDAVAIDSTIVGNGFGPIKQQEPAGARTSGGPGVLGLVGGGGLVGDSVHLDNSTVVDNNGFGASSGVDIVSLYSTVSGNGINLVNFQPKTIHLFASVVIEPETANCIGTVADEGFNFVDDDSCSPVAMSTADPMLGALAFNGGQTDTRLPGTGSPLIDGVPLASCGKVSTDQRGIARPQGGGCDIGSVEVQASAPSTPGATPGPTPVAGELPDTSLPVTAGILAMVLSVVLVGSVIALAAVRVRQQR